MHHHHGSRAATGTDIRQQIAADHLQHHPVGHTGQAIMHRLIQHARFGLLPLLRLLSARCCAWKRARFSPLMRSASAYDNTITSNIEPLDAIFGKPGARQHTEFVQRKHTDTAAGNAPGGNKIPAAAAHPCWPPANRQQTKPAQSPAPAPPPHGSSGCRAGTKTQTITPNTSHAINSQSTTNAADVCSAAKNAR